MQIIVKLYATLRLFAPEGTDIGEAFEVNLDGETIRLLIKLLGIIEEKARIIMVNGIQIHDMEHHLESGNLVVIFPPIGGG